LLRDTRLFWAGAGKQSGHALIHRQVEHRCRCKWFSVTCDTHGFWNRDTPTPEQSVPLMTSAAAGNAERANQHAIDM